jgi:hypothetical protein
LTVVLSTCSLAITTTDSCILIKQAVFQNEPNCCNAASATGALIERN